MDLPIKGLHHVTSKSSDPRATNRFWRSTLGLRRVKQTVNFDNPKVYHLYYGNERGEAGTVMTYFPFPGLARGERGTGEVSLVSFSVPKGSLELWEARLETEGASDVVRSEAFGEACLEFDAPDGDRFRMVETTADRRNPWPGSGLGQTAIRGFHGVTLTLAETETTAAVLTAFGYREIGEEANVARFALPSHNGAGLVDLCRRLDLGPANEGAGSVHHVAFAVADRAAQDSVREAMLKAGHRVTHVYDRNYFYAIYFRTPGGVLFEVATEEPGFDSDEPLAHLGEALQLPAEHAHLRGALDETLIRLD